MNIQRISVPSSTSENCFESILRVNCLIRISISNADRSKLCSPGVILTIRFTSRLTGCRTITKKQYLKRIINICTDCSSCHYLLVCNCLLIFLILNHPRLYKHKCIFTFIH